MKNTIKLIPALFCILTIFTGCDKETKKFKKETEALMGNYTIEHYTLQEYDPNTYEQVTNIDSDTTTGEFNLKSDGSAYSKLNEFRFNTSIPTRFMARIRSKVPIQDNYDGTESVSWRPDATDKRFFVFYNQIEGNEYIIFTIEKLEKNRFRWTYMESFNGFDGGSISSVKLKEVLEVKRG